MLRDCNNILPKDWKIFACGITMISTINASRVPGNDSAISRLLTNTLTAHSALMEATGRSEYQATGKLITINVSGKRFETFEETLEFFPNTLLGSSSRRGEYFNSSTGEYFFDRHRGSFGAILYFYQSNGSLIRPDSVPVHVFFKECVFFQLPEEVVDEFQIESGVLDEEEERPMPSNEFCKMIWETMEYPDTSKLAKILAILSVIIISASLVIFCLETMPVFNPPPPDCPGNITSCPEKDNYVNPYERVWFVMNCAIIGWFTAEFVIRLLTCPNIAKFLVAPLNIIDMLSILPFYVTLALQGTLHTLYSSYVPNSPDIELFIL